MMGPSESGGDFVVEEPEPGVYNPTGADPPVWQPAPQDILHMFELLDTEQVLPLKWVCPGRRPPEKEVPEQPMDFMSDEEDDEDKDEEKRAPEPSAFDFDDTASEASSKVQMTPRTPVSAKVKRPEKKVARMDNVLNSIKRQQKAEREARKSQARTLGATPFRGGTPSRMASFSPAASPRLPASSTASPGPSSPRGSPRMGAPTGSPLSRLGGSGEAGSKASMPESPSTTGDRAAGSPSSARGASVIATSVSPKPPVSETPAAVTHTEPSGQVTIPDSVPVGVSSATVDSMSVGASTATTVSVSAGVSTSAADPIKPQSSSGLKPEPVPMETDSVAADSGQQS